MQHIQRLFYVMLLFSVVCSLSACSQELKKVAVYESQKSEDWRFSSIEIRDNYAYSNQEGLTILDVSDPVSPTIVAVVDTPASQITIAGDYAYLTDRQYGLRIVDISTPHYPVVLGHYPTTERPMKSVVKDDYVYLTTYVEGGLHVIDVSDPRIPRQVNVYKPLGGEYEYVDEIAIKDNYIFLEIEALSGSYLQILDISTPHIPEEVTLFNIGTINDMIVTKDYIYLTNGGTGLHILDISAPTTPTHIGSYDTPDYAGAIVIEGDYAYINDYFGVQVIDISDPKNPTRLGYSKDVKRSWEIGVVDRYIYVSDEKDLSIFKKPQ